MKISELPEPYRSLARLRSTQREYYGLGHEAAYLGSAFNWGKTPEGLNFWVEVHAGKTPSIPDKSLHELMTIEEIAAMPGSYTMHGFTPGNLYAFWDGDEPQEWTVARYSHSERTTPFDRHWTQDKKYFAHVCECLFTVDRTSVKLWQILQDIDRAGKELEILAPEEGA